MRRFYSKLWIAWYYGLLQGVKCWPRLGHRWMTTVGCGDPDCRWCIEETYCAHCGVEQGRTRLFLLWGGIPIVWRLSCRIKHGRWTLR